MTEEFAQNPSVPEPSRDGQPVHLTPTEKRLYLVLRQEPERVFSREELVKQVMPRTIVLERTIDVHIRSLRKKLGANSIRTIHGQGYRWNGE